MKNFAQLYELFLHRFADDEQSALAALPENVSNQELRDLGDDRYLSTMVRCVFQAGFTWRVIDYKWKGFETVFNNFVPAAVAYFSDEKIEELMQDERIVRNRQKIMAAHANAAFVFLKSQETDGFGNWIADWPNDDIVGLWLALKKQGSRLGGNTGSRVLRIVGKDTFILTQDVCNALLRHGLVHDLSPNSQRGQRKAEKAFLDLQQESGWPLCRLSRMLAFTL